MSFQFSSLADQVRPVTSLTNPVVGFRTDGSNVDVTITIRSASVPKMDQRRLKEAAIWVGLHAVQDGDRIQPIFVFRVGGWYFQVPVDFDDASPGKQEALRRACSGTKDSAEQGSWTLIFRLVEAATMTTAALRSVALTNKIQEEAAALFLKSLGDPRRMEARTTVSLQEAFLTDHALFEALEIADRVA
jgi:hypothetical protein